MKILKYKIKVLIAGFVSSLFLMAQATETLSSNTDTDYDCPIKYYKPKVFPFNTHTTQNQELSKKLFSAIPDAINENNISLVQDLLLQGAKPNIPDNNGQTARDLAPPNVEQLFDEISY